MLYDAIIVGGSFAGLSAAIQLARARRRILVIDAGLPRNRFADTAHGFLGQDGKKPAAIIQEAQRQLLAYPTVEIVHGEAVQASKVEGGFNVALAGGREEMAARLILAIGIKDEMPPLAGLQERWGKTVLPCPYCHGYEVGGLSLGVLASHPLSMHQALLISDWGPTTYFTQGVAAPNEEEQQSLAAHGVTVEPSPIVELLGAAPELEGVRLNDGRVVPIAALFIAPKTSISSPLAEQLGCTIDEGPNGPLIRVDELKQTTVAGVYAAGDAVSAMYNATLASASGVMAGVVAHRSLVFDTIAPK